jgi:hypothetical protein
VGADQNQGTVFFEISHQAVGGRAPVIAIHEGAVKCDPAAGLSIVINLAQILNLKEVRMSDRWGTNRQYRVSRGQKFASAASSHAVGGAIFGGAGLRRRRCLPGGEDPAPIEPSNNAQTADDDFVDGLDAGALELGSFCKNGVYPDAAAATG